MTRRFAVAGLVSLIAAISVPRMATGQAYEVSWSTVDGGGAMGTAGGQYIVDSTSGQPDAGGPSLGGTYALHGGFWALIAAAGPVFVADLGVTKTDGQAAAIPGQDVTYTIVVTNAGPDDANGATVTDAPPASFNFLSWTCSASAGSSCPPSGIGPITHSVNVAVGGTLTYSLTGPVDPTPTGSLVNTAVVTAPPGVVDPNLGNNSATDTDMLTPQADLALSLSDFPDPVGSGATLTYTVLVPDQGPSTSSGMTLTVTLPPQVAFVSCFPDTPFCNFASGAVTCNLPFLTPTSIQDVTIQVRVNPGFLGTLGIAASVTGNDPDPVAGNNNDSESTQVIPAAEGELVHGTVLLADLESVGGAADEDVFRIPQRAHASYEVVVDGTSGDIGTGQGPALDRLASDATTVLQSAAAAGAGGSRSLSWQNTTGAVVDGEYVRVRSQGCTTACDASDVYRIRAWETTSRAARFNNSASQRTVVILQNTAEQAISGRISFWDATGLLVHEQAFDVAPRGVFSLSTAALAPLQGQSGTMTVSHDGPYAALAGKAVAIEPSTGFTFDTVLEPRPLR
jgi:uncharacterized repeat protein (TIGR01451 family)